MVKRYSNLKMVWDFEKNSGELVTTHVAETLQYLIDYLTYKDVFLCCSYFIYLPSPKSSRW